VIILLRNESLKQENVVSFRGTLFPWPSDYYMLAQTWPTLVTHSTSSLNLLKSCDYFVKNYYSLK